MPEAQLKKAEADGYHKWGELNQEDHAARLEQIAKLREAIVQNNGRPTAFVVVRPWLFPRPRKGEK
jgi:hypothetical protein